MKEAGEKLLGHAHAASASEPAGSASAGGADKAKAANDAAGEAIKAYIEKQGLKATGLTVTFDGATSTVTVYGVAADQATKEKIVLSAGNVQGVEKVNDQMTVDQS